MFDTSAFINGWRTHLRPATFPSVWRIVGEALDDGRIVCPREVLKELRRQADELSAWVEPHAAAFVDPLPPVQREAGRIYAMLPNPGIRDAADPFVIAEARLRGFAVVTYEGLKISGEPTPKWHTKMPGICNKLGVDCMILPEALGRLGASI